MRFTVVIPTYNRALTVPRAIRSVLAQTHADLELVVVDDGSNDNTKAVVSRFTDPRLRYLRQGNRGVSAARNAGAIHVGTECLIVTDLLNAGEGEVGFL